jgi:hypothetical protein
MEYCFFLFTKRRPALAMNPEFDLLMARAGIAIPGDRRPALLAAYLDLRAALVLLADAEAEPAHVFRPDPLGGL